MRAAGVLGGTLTTKRVNLDLGKSRLFGIQDRVIVNKEEEDHDGIMELKGRKKANSPLKMGNGNVIATNYGVETLHRRDCK